MTPNPNKETPEQELESLAITPCFRCFQCDFKRSGECMNPYKECSICAIIRQLAKDFATHYKAREAEIAKEAEIALARKVLAVSSGVPKLRGFTQAKRLKLLTAKMNEIIPDSGLFVTEDSQS